MTRQWSFNGAEILGATNDTLSLGNAEPTESGLYALAATNPISGRVSRQSVQVNVTPAPLADFSRIDNAGTAYSTLARPDNETGLRKLVIAVRFRIDAQTAGSNIFAQNSEATARFWMPTLTGLRLQMFSSNRVSLRPSIVTAVGHVRTHIVTLDFTNTNAGEGARWATDIDGVLLNNATGTGGTFDTRTTAGSGTDYGSHSFALTGTSQIFSTAGVLGLFANGAGGNLFNGAIDYLWMDWGNADYVLPDITSPVVRNSWLPGNVGSNGNGPTGSQPKIFLAGTAADWNAGFTNRGSLNLALTKQAGAYE